MAEDFSNGLDVVPLDANQFLPSSIAPSVEHPWRDQFVERAKPPARSVEPPSTKAPPFRYMYDNQLHGPQRRTNSVLDMLEEGRDRPLEPHETIRLCDVEAFRKNTAEKARAINGASDAPSSIRPVIYRYIDVIKNSFALLEAIHFELFMPDRPDLRFLALPWSAVPAGTVEGDYIQVPTADLLSDPSFAIKLGETSYPVVWEAKRVERMKMFGQREYTALAYIVKKKANAEGSLTAIVETFDRDMPIRETLFDDDDTRREHSLVRVTMRDVATAQLYPVEPHVATAQLYPVEPHVCKSIFMRMAMALDDAMSDDFSGPSVTEEWKRNERVDEVAEGDTKKREDGAQSEYVKRVAGVLTSSQRVGRVVTAVRALDATEAERIEDRLGAFAGFAPKPLDRTMVQLFLLGCRYRISLSQGVEWSDLGQTRVDDSVVLRTIEDARITEDCSRTLNYIYGRFPPARRLLIAAIVKRATRSVEAEPITAGGRLLNLQQGLAVRLYADALGPRVFCIRSPPGSGKTTVAAAMAAEVLKRGAANPRDPYYVGVQLLLSVQNVAVDNIGDALQKMEYGRGMLYNMKSTKLLNPYSPSPYDYFDQIGDGVEDWKEGGVSMWLEKRVGRGRFAQFERSKFKTREECLTYHRRSFEGGIQPKILLSTVEMVLQKLYTPSKLCEALKRVTRIVIDEASLLTESALFCIIRRFPKARIVLMGDDHQLPPFMYDENILGHELAGRSALSVAMKSQIIPVVELTEVYRAPPSLVAPYNRLAYEGKLDSKLAEGETPLCEIGLIHSGLPQLLLIDVDGKEERNEKSMSLYNEKEVGVAIRLLKKFPKDCTKDIMIICLYKDQKKRLQEVLEAQYARDPIPANLYTVLTVDSAQGKEAPIVILLTTRTQRATDFFCSTERCNVAVSRQQKALIILGRAPLLTTNKPWSTVVNGDDFTCIDAGEIQ